MQSPSVVGRISGSPSAMDESSAKKARLELANGHVKQEAAGEGGAGALVAAEYGSRVELTVRIDMRVLHCPLCSRPYKPRVFKCKDGHFACAACVAELPDGQCGACEDGGGGGGFDPCPELDTVVSSTRVACPHAGCGRLVVYHQAAEHQNGCAHAPCRCTEPGCGFLGLPAALAGHLAAAHYVPVHSFQYGKVLRVQAPSEPGTRLLLVAEDDGRAFLATVGALGGAAAVSVVCIRASAAARPQFTCRMWVNLGAVADNNKVLVEMQMRSSTSPGAVVATDEPTFLPVLPRYLVPGDGPSMEVPLSVRIDRVSPWSS